MAHAPAAPTSTSAALAEHATPAAPPAVQHPPVSPGKVAMWLFLATEIMFFTGLIGSYIVLRSGSPPTSYPNLYAPATDVTQLRDDKAVVLLAVGNERHRVAELYRESVGKPSPGQFRLSEAEAAHAIHRT